MGSGALVVALACFIFFIVVTAVLVAARILSWISESLNQELINYATLVSGVASFFSLIIAVLAFFPLGSPLRTPSLEEPIAAPTYTRVEAAFTFTALASPIPIATSIPSLAPPAPMPSPSTPTPTPPTPADVPSPTLVPTQTQQPTSTPTAIPSPTFTPACPTVVGPFASSWGLVQETIGCALDQAVTGFIVEESFLGGKMFWREPIDYAQILALFNDGTWQIVKHSPFIEGSPDFSCPDANTPSQCPPTPKRGFGMVWCDTPEIRNRLGNALDCEWGYQGTMQQFERGFMLQTDTGAVYVFYDNGRWERK